MSQLTPDLDLHSHASHHSDPLANLLASSPSTSHPFTSMSSALHVIRLRRIESQIQQSMYRLDQRQDLNEARSLLDRLDRWKEGIPRKPADSAWASMPCCSEDWFLMKGESARLMLLRPVAAKAKPGDPMLVQCAQSAAQLCEVSRILWRR